MLRIGLVALGLGAMIAAALKLSDLSFLGFPDGYVTPYDRATEIWVTGLTYALLVAGIFTLAAAAFRKPRRAVAGAAIALLLYLSLAMLDACPRLEWCTTGVQQLTGVYIDDGTGG